MAILLPNGIGETQGDSLVTNGPYQATGQVFYVSSVTGDAGASGLNKARPLNTLANAHTAAANGDTIVLLDGHTETLSGVITISKNVTVVASGSSSGVPTVSFQGSNGFSYIRVTGAGVQLRNIKFKTRTVADTTVRVSIGAANVSVIGCYFECSGLDTGAGLGLDNAIASFTCRNTTFISTATVATAAAYAGLEFGGTTTDAVLDGLVFDGGSVGFISGYAFLEVGAATRRRGENITMIRGADVLLNASSVQSYWMPTTTTGDARVMT